MANLVRRAAASEGNLVELVTADDRLGSEAAALLEPGVSVTRRTTHGAGGPRAVATQIERFRSRLSDDEKRLASQLNAD